MELVTVSKAIELIQLAAPGALIHLGLYKDAENEEEYNDLALLLGYESGATILDGPHKVFSTFKYEQPYATGWIDGRAYRPDREPGLYDDITVSTVKIGANGYFYWWNYRDDFGNVNLNAIANDISRTTDVIATYDANSDKILLTSKIPGPRGCISLTEPEDKSYWDNANFKFISANALRLDISGIYQNAAHIIVKNTDLVNIDYEKVYDIHIKVNVAAGQTINLSERWIWDEYSEDEEEFQPVINWGDTNTDTVITNVTDISHRYSRAGEYIIKIKGLHLCENNENVSMPISEICFYTPQVVTTDEDMLYDIPKVEGIITVSKAI
jgi:hypothetical protein